MGLTCFDPHGAFYAFPNIEGTGIAARTLQDLLLEETGVATVSGTSFGGLSGLAAAGGLKLRISHVLSGDVYYWRGTAALGWSSMTVTDLPVDYTSSASTITWRYPPLTYDPPTISTDNHEYFIAVAGLDKAGNAEAFSSIKVTSDFNYPSIVISTPMAAASAFYGPTRATGDLLGSSVDSPAGIVPPVLTQISNLSESGAVKPKWNGSAWQVTPSSWLAVSGVGSWSYTPPTWPLNKRFRVELKATDNAGNVVPDGVYARDLIFDTNRASSTITAPSHPFHNASSAAVFSGGASDWVAAPAVEAMSGLAPNGVDVQIADTAGNTFNGSAFAGAGNWLTAPTILASNGVIHDTVRAFLQPACPAP